MRNRPCASVQVVAAVLAAGGAEGESDRKLYWRPEGVRHSERAGQDEAAVYADPRFPNAPILHTRSMFIVGQREDERKDRCTSSKLYLTATPVSDHLDGDGVRDLPELPDILR